MKPFATIAIVVFLVIAALQLVRLLMGWVVTVAGFVIPVWLSGVAFILTAVLAVMLWRESRR